jgi:hypothetical protein
VIVKVLSRAFFVALVNYFFDVDMIMAKLAATLSKTKPGASTTKTSYHRANLTNSNMPF